MDSMAAGVQRNFCSKDGRCLGEFLDVAQIKKLFQTGQNDFLNFFATDIGKKCVILN